MAAKMPIELPYNLKHDELAVIDGVGKTMDEEMGWFNDHISWSDEPTVERIFRSTVILYNRTDNQNTLGECFAQALIWEVG